MPQSYRELILARKNVRIRESDKNIECCAGRADAGPTIPGLWLFVGDRGPRLGRARCARHAALS